MAVIVSNGATNLSTVNGFYRAESFNLGFGHYISPAVHIDLINLATQNITFSNSGNCLGIIVGFGNWTPGEDFGHRLGLQENKGTFTVSIANPAVITLAGHGFTGGEEVVLETTGALPTGLTGALTRRYVNYIDVNTFNISNTPGGDNIITSGSQSGTHTLWVTRRSKLLMRDEISADPDANSQSVAVNIVPFEFDTGYPVDTNAGKWRFYVQRETNAGQRYFIMTSAGVGTISHVAWCDNAVSFADNDVLICKDRVTIDQSATLRGITATSNTVWNYAAVICRSLDLTENGISNLVWETNPTASHTLTVNGTIWVGSFAGMQIGSATNPIPAAYPAKLVFLNAVTSGTTRAGISFPWGNTATRPSGRSAFICYGEVPTKRFSRLASEALPAQNKIVLTEDLSGDWQVGDRLVIGKQDIKNDGSLIIFTIVSFSGTEITLTPNISSPKRFAGAPVINLSRQYGIEFSSSVTNGGGHLFLIDKPIHQKVVGCMFRDCAMYSNSYSAYGNLWSSLSKKVEITDNLCEMTQSTIGYFYSVGHINRDGNDLKRNLSFRANFLEKVGSHYTNVFSSGKLSVEDNIAVSSRLSRAGELGTTANIISYLRNEWYGQASNFALVVLHGKDVEFKDNIVWGTGGTTGINSGAVVFGTFCNKPFFSGNKFDNNNSALSYISPGGLCIEGISRNDEFGLEVTNTIDFNISAGVLGDFLLRSPKSNNSSGIIVSSDALGETNNGFKLRIQNNNGLPNVDRVFLTEGQYVRCGDGLADTTTRLGGANNFSLRMEALNEPLKFEQYVPTGNIENKTMSVGVWIKLNSVNYWSGTHVMPKLIIEYDDGVIAYATAAQSTEWQLLIVPFEPLTTMGRIKVTFQTQSNMIGSDAYVYWDDMSVLFPPGVQLNLGNMDLWTGGEPITPAIATNVSAADLWNFPTTNLSSPGTTGKKLKDGLTTGSFVGLK